MRIVKTEDKFIHTKNRCFAFIEDLITKYRKEDLVAENGQTIRLRLGESDISTSKEIKSHSFRQRSYYMGGISQKDCKVRLMESESGTFFIREIDEVVQLCSN